MTDAPTPVEELTYAQAVEELDAILEDLERDDLDVDHLAGTVARAAELIRECRSRIAATRFKVDRIVADLHPDNPATPAGRPVATQEDAG